MTIQIARLLLWIESAIWLVAGALLIAGGLLVLGGGSGIPGIVHVDEPGFAQGVSTWAVALGIGVAALAAWGLWTAWALRSASRRILLNAFCYAVVWIALGLAWIGVATTAVPGAVTAIVNAAIVMAVIAAASSKATVSPKR